MLDLNLIYYKTDAGVNEVHARTLGLRAELRRLLILIDGQTPLSRLSIYVRGHELEAFIYELETQGLITSPAASSYRKTDAGVQEVRNRALHLRPELRRLLILIDGRTPLARIEGLFPGYDVRVLMDELVSMGLALSPHAPPTATAPAPEVPRISDEHLAAVRNAAIRELHDILGPPAASFAERIRRPADSVELRGVISQIQEALDLQYGFSTGQRFIAAVRASGERFRNGPA